MKVNVQECLNSTQTWLRAATVELGSLEAALEKFMASHGIRGKTNGRFLLLDYHQHQVRWTEPYGYVCRGLILDATTFDVVSMPLTKAFNFGDHYAAPVNLETARSFVKVDGTLCQRFWNPHTSQFELSTRFQFHEDLFTNLTPSGTITWAVMFAKCFKGWEDVLGQQPKDQTWVFECCSPANIVVVQNSEFFAKILTARDLRTLKEIRYEDLLSIEGGKPEVFSFKTAQEVLDFANSFPAVKNEGFIRRDHEDNCDKIKSKEYERLHHLKDGLKGIWNLLDLARQPDYAKTIEHLPEYKPDLDLIARLYERTIVEHEAVYEKWKHLESQKEFAIKVKNLGLRNSGALFLTRAGKQPGVREAFAALEPTAFGKMFKDEVRALLGNKYAENPAIEGA